MPRTQRQAALPTRQALLDAAKEAFATHGFAGTSIRALAGAVGIKESSFYNHFPSKQALLDAVLDLAEQRLGQTGEQFAVPLEDASAAADVYEHMSRDRLEEVAAGFARLWLTDPDVIAARRILTLEQFRTPEAGARLRGLTVQRPLAFQAELFTALIERGGFREADPQAVALAFWGPIHLILSGASGPADLDEALRRIHLHLEHFCATHLADDAPARPARGSHSKQGGPRPRPAGQERRT